MRLWITPFFAALSIALTSFRSDSFASLLLADSQSFRNVRFKLAIRVLVERLCSRLRSLLRLSIARRQAKRSSGPLSLTLFTSAMIIGAGDNAVSGRDVNGAFGVPQLQFPGF